MSDYPVSNDTIVYSGCQSCRDFSRQIAGLKSQLEAQVSALNEQERTIDGLKAQLAAMRAALDKNQFVPDYYNELVCQICDSGPEEGHEPYCWIGQLLANSSATVEQYQRERDAKVLRDAADDAVNMPLGLAETTSSCDEAWILWLRARADALAAGRQSALTPPETTTQL